jgi:hypothetical protein
MTVRLELNNMANKICCLLHAGLLHDLHLKPVGTFYMLFKKCSGFYGIVQRYIQEIEICKYVLIVSCKIGINNEEQDQ